MTGGEKRLARRLEDKLEDDYLLWYDVPVGRSNLHPDFIVFNPRRGLLVLEVKDWRLDSIQSIDSPIPVSNARPTRWNRRGNTRTKWSIFSKLTPN
jgi:hypothetical protein